LVINRFAYANFDDDSDRFYIYNPYAFRSAPRLYKNKIAFTFSGSDILAAPVIDLSKEEFGEFKTVATYGFESEYAYLFRDKILLYGENDSFAIGEISTIS